MAGLLALVILAASCGSSADTSADSEAPSSASTPADDAAADDSTDDAATDETEATTDDPDDTDDVDGAYPLTIGTAAGEVVIDAQPMSIVSLSPTATEMLFAIEAGDQVTAVDLFSNYPPEAPQGTLDAFAPEFEAILAAGPDLVVAANLPEDIVAALAASDVPVLLQPGAVSFDDIYDQIGQLGVATGQIDGAAAVNDEIRTGVDEVLSGIAESEEPVRVFHELDDSFYTATSGSFIGQVYQLMGFENVADPYDDGGGYPLIDGETVIAADPTLIVLPKSEYSTYGPEEIMARPGWEGIAAVANGNVIEVDADISSRWGPRIVEFMQALAETVLAPA
ncbi:MAG: ABC transporter substrate-binding protein [Acidimicrobiales bacterium]